ncbi:transposase [Streptosporangium sp. NPDC004631]
MTPPIMRTWAPRGQTPIITVRGRSRRRSSIAAPACHKPGQRSRLIYRPRLDTRPDERKSFAWSDYRDLLIAAHRQLGGPIVLVWDNLNTHLTAGMRAFIAVQDRLTVVRPPIYAPDLNPVEGIWSPLRRAFPANIAFTNPEHLIRTVRQGLRTIQYRSDLIDHCLAGTGLTLTPA